LKAFNDLMSENKPVWGLVSSDIKGMLNKVVMKSPSTLLLRMFLKQIPSNVLSGAELLGVDSSGGVKLKYMDLGETTKYFVGNGAYYQKLAEAVKNNLNIVEPLKTIVYKTLQKLMGAEGKLIKTASMELTEDYLAAEELG